MKQSFIEIETKIEKIKNKCANNDPEDLILDLAWAIYTIEELIDRIHEEQK